MGKKRVKISDLVSGMIVADDVYSSSDQQIIAKRSIINEKLIAKLKVFNVPAINIMDVEEEAPVSQFEEDMTVMTQTEKLKTTEEYKRFRRDFSKMTNALQKCLTRIADKGITQHDIDEIYNIAGDIVATSLNMPHIFDMLHSMRGSSDSVYTHSVNVAVISIVLGKWLRFSPYEQELLAVAGLVHDIGKLLIPENILVKPYELTDKEFAIVKSHALRGYTLIKDSALDEHVKNAVLMHHERCNGSGYPAGTKGDKIDQFAKVVAIADVYDAMTSSRIYRDTICPFDVIRNFEKDGLHIFEIEYIMTFLKHIANTYIHSQVRLSNGIIGEIIMLNNNNLSKPVVKAGDTFIDLAKEPDLKIDEIL